LKEFAPGGFCKFVHIRSSLLAPCCLSPDWTAWPRNACDNCHPAIALCSHLACQAR
jgi:hypothetical protein